MRNSTLRNCSDLFFDEWEFATFVCLLYTELYVTIFYYSRLLLVSLTTTIQFRVTQIRYRTFIENERQQTSSYLVPTLQKLIHALMVDFFFFFFFLQNTKRGV